LHAAAARSSWQPHSGCRWQAGRARFHALIGDRAPPSTVLIECAFDHDTDAAIHAARPDRSPAQQLEPASLERPAASQLKLYRRPPAGCGSYAGR